MYFESVIKFLQPFLDEASFKKVEEGKYSSENAEIRIEFDESRSLYNLYFTENGEEKLISSYLFEENQTEKDAESVAIDFTDTLRKKLNIKKSVKRSESDIELPSKSTGDKTTVTGVAQKLLAIFPEHKDNYRAFVAKYGKFLYIEFTKIYFAGSFKNLLINENKKTVKKAVDALYEMFVSSDKEAYNFICLLLSLATYNSDEASASLKEALKEKMPLYLAVQNLKKEISSSRKLREELLK